MWERVIGVPMSASGQVQMIAPRSAATILVVDDDPSIRQTIVEILDLEGYPVAQATNGAEALEYLDHELPALILLDMRMPVLDGWGFARALQERGLRLPILVLTAAQNARRWAEEIDAAGVLAKPFDIRDLLAAVEALWPGHGSTSN